jgi:2-C-methyl-D-erythritol 2,4-cyclodiphosphate synthase
VALGDIGQHFPDTDAKWKGANSRQLLLAVVAMIATKGYKLGNADITIVAQQPKMLPHLDKMRLNLSADMGCNIDQINIKATTTEELGFAGRKEGIACHAVALLVSS